MASPQVEIMFTSSPFGRDAKLNIISDHLNNLPISSDSAPVKNTHKPTWVSRAANKNNNNLESLSFTRRFNNLCGDHKDDSSSLSALMSPRHSQIIDRWAARQAQEVIHVDSLETIHSRRQVSVSPPRSDGSSESEKNSILGASSLVQMWEKRLNKSNSTTKQNTPPTSPIRTSLDEENCRISEESESSSFDEQFPDWESDKTDHSCSSKVLHYSDVVTEREGGKIADIIKRLAVTNNDENDHDLSNSASSSPYRERGSVSTPKQLPEHKGFCQLTSSPRIRGRQAFNDLMMQFESDRHGELNNLAQRGAVSRFRQRGRIQSLLRLRLLQRGVAAFDPSRHNHKSSAAPEVNKQHGSAIIPLK